jgi:hypothetical protein
VDPELALVKKKLAKLTSFAMKNAVKKLSDQMDIGLIPTNEKGFRFKKKT